MEPTIENSASAPDTQPATAQPPAIIPAAIPPEQPRGRITIEDLKWFPDAAKSAIWIQQFVDAEVARYNYSYDRTLARDFAISGQFEDIKNLSMEQAIATALIKIQIGRNWGLSVADSMRFIYFANGRPSLENEIIASHLQAKNYSWDIEWQETTIEVKDKPPWIKCTGCRLWVKKDGQPLIDRYGKAVSVAFTESDADHALVYDKGRQIPLSAKWNFQSWGRDMYYWRCISRIRKFYAPGILRGAVTREEALEMTPADALPPPEQPPASGPAAQTELPPEPVSPPPPPQPQPPTSPIPKQKLRDKILQHQKQRSLSEAETDEGYPD